MKNLNYSKIQSISMINIAKEAFAFILTNKIKIINSVKYPAALSIILTIFLNSEQGDLNLSFAVSAIAHTYLYILIVIRLHRLFLLNEEEYSLKRSLIWRNNHYSYLFTTIAFGIVTIFLATPLVLFLPAITNLKSVNITIMIAALFPIGYLLSRFSLVLPSIAISDKIEFGESWQISKNNGLKVFILIILTPIAFNSAVDFVHLDSIAFRPIYSLLGIIAIVFEVIILSNTYKTLIEQTAQTLQT